MEEFEKWLSVDPMVEKLFLGLDRAGARRSLRESAQAESAAGRLDAAAFWANQLGSLSAADGLDDEALSAYVWAEQLDPYDGRLKVTTANFLLLVANQPVSAEAKIDEAIALLEKDADSGYHSRYFLGHARALKAVARLEQGDREFAISQFREWSARDRIARLASGGLDPDLRLVRALYSKGIMQNEVLAYLHAALAKSIDEGNDHMVREIQQLLSMLGAG